MAKSSRSHDRRFVLSAHSSEILVHPGRLQIRNVQKGRHRSSQMDLSSLRVATVQSAQRLFVFDQHRKARLRSPRPTKEVLG